MSMLGDVFGSLESMSLMQLLLAFFACSAYASAQGSLLPPKGRRFAWVTAAVAAGGFVADSSEWTFAAMLLGFAIAGMGSFIALVWLTSRALGLGRNLAASDVAAGDAAPVGAVARNPSPRGPTAGEHAHSI